MVDILSIFSSVFGTPDLPYNVGRSTVDPSDYRYPIDQNYPAYIQYRAKKVYLLQSLLLILLLMNIKQLCRID